MRLSDWLEQEKAVRDLTREEFARRIGRSPGLITQICDGAWVSRATAQAIFRETKGAVTPNDLAGVTTSLVSNVDTAVA
jgi:3,4-dihydroxy 2-butanone 4-phosphate synthase/GTP cyclohydrolase II